MNMERIHPPQPEKKNWFRRHPATSSMIAITALSAAAAFLLPPEDPVEVQRRKDARAEFDSCMSVYLSPEAVREYHRTQMFSVGKPTETIETAAICHDVVEVKFPTTTVPEN